MTDTLERKFRPERGRNFRVTALAPAAIGRSPGGGGTTVIGSAGRYDTAARTIALDRRTVIAGGLSVALAPLTGTAAMATPAELQTAIGRIAAGTPVRPGRITLDIPALADSGNGVPLTITVDSPMTAADHVREIHLLSEVNPSTRIATFHLGPRAGHARVSTSIRLAASQDITAIARMSDGSLWSGKANVVVTATACSEDTL